MRRSRRNDERGAVIVFVGVLMTVLLVFAAFAVDLGMQRVARRDMQALADVVALDVARSLGGRTVNDIKTKEPTLATLAERSRARNGGTLGSTPTLSLRLGQIDANGVFTELTALTARPTAVEVSAETDVDFTFVGGSGGAIRSAVAVPGSVACISVGAVAASLDTNQWPLSRLLGSIVGEADLDVLSPGGVLDLKSLRVPLLGVAAELEVATVDELVSVPGLTIGRFVLAVAEVLQDSEGRTAGVKLLEGIAALDVGNVALTLGDILDIAPGSDAALNLHANAFELVQAALFVAGKDDNPEDVENAIAVPGVSVAVPPPPATALVELETRISIVEPPTIACGPADGTTTARNAQLRLHLTGALLSKAGWPLGLRLLVRDIDVHLRLDLGVAEARLDRVTCASGAPGAVDNVVLSGTTAILETELVLELELLAGLLRPEIGVGPTTSVAQTTFQEQSLSFSADGPRPTKTVSAELTSLGLGSVTPTVRTGLWLIDAVLGDLLGLVVRPLIAGLDLVLTPLVNLLTSTLGIDLASVRLAGESLPDCNFATLRG